MSSSRVQISCTGVPGIALAIATAWRDEIDIQPPAKTAADELRMDANLRRLDARRLRRPPARPADTACWPTRRRRPRHAREAVLWLERRVREHWRGVARLDRLALASAAAASPACFTTAPGLVLRRSSAA